MISDSKNYGVDSSEDNKISTQPLLVEPYILGLAICLVVFSILMVYSATGMMAMRSSSDELYYVKRQLAAVFIGSCLAFVSYLMPVYTFRRWAWLGLPLSLVLLLAVFIPGLGVKGGGAQRWIDLRIVHFQPGELVKILMIFVIARYFSKHEKSVGSFVSGIVKPMIIIAPVIPLFLLQRDFGSFAVLLLVTLCMANIAGVRLRHFIICGFGCFCAVLPMVLLAPYRLKRLVAYLDPFQDSSGDGYQLIQSLIALGSGEVLGQGLGRSQQKLYYLPAAHTDFIFAVVGEELGFIGCLVILFIFFILLIRIVKLAHRLASDLFLCLLALGLGLLLVVPALLNMGVVTGLLPTKGLVLPLIGYGGSNMISSLLIVGWLLNLFKVAQLRR
jgi:cell division protein FtsW